MRPFHPSIPKMPADSPHCGARATKHSELTYRGVTIAVMVWLLASLWMLH
jgi:hypothetical protein